MADCMCQSFVMQWHVTLRPAFLANFVHTAVVRTHFLLFVLIGVSFLECPVIFSLHELYEMGPSGKRVTTMQDGDHCGGALIFEHQQRPRGGGDHFERP